MAIFFLQRVIEESPLEISLGVHEGEGGFSRGGRGLQKRFPRDVLFLSEMPFLSTRNVLLKILFSFVKLSEKSGL